MANYVLEGPRWGNGAMGTSGGTVSWAVDASVPASFVSVINAAFNDWTSYANISFTRASSPSSAQIVFSDASIDGPNKVLGNTVYSYYGPTFSSAAVTFDSDEGWHAVGNQIVSNSSINLYVVAVHEIGHSIGLDHYNGSLALMNSYLDRSVTDVMAPDIAGVQALYGAPVIASGPKVVSSPASFGTTEYSAASNAGTVYALYKGLLGRTPDTLGLEGWAGALNGGMTPTAMAASILASPEYANRTASPLSDSAFVASLYANLLNRAPDAQGQALFQGELSSGMSRAQVVTQIASSGEAQAWLQPTFSTGVAVPDATSAQVARLYYGVLGRAPDGGGLTAMQSFAKSAGLGAVAQAMLSSQEFSNTHGALSDTSYIDSLYMGALGHHADTAATSYWSGQLAASSRTQVAVQISQSAEAQVHLVGQVEQGNYVLA